MDEYLTKMKMIVDNLRTVGYLITDEDLKLHVFAGLGSKYTTTKTIYGVTIFSVILLK